MRTFEPASLVKKGFLASYILLFLGVPFVFADDSNAVHQSSISVQSQKFTYPKTLVELLSLNSDQLENIDIARINLLCAEGLHGSENLNVQSSLDRLDAWAIHVADETKRNFHHFTESPQDFNSSIAYYRMGMLGTILVEDLGIQYDPVREQQQHDAPIGKRSVEEWNRFFSDSQDVFIGGLLWDKHYGTCSSMPFLYVAIARRLGYPVNLAATKYHLYARYEEDGGKHLNIEATENHGFSTPSDEEYKSGPYPPTDEEIKSCGWLRPLNNKEILGICLLNRANVLRSMKHYPDAIAAMEQAAHYLPDTPLMKRALEKNRLLALNLQAADQWDTLSGDLEKLSLPTGGPQASHFQDQWFQIQFSMNHSTNLVEIETEVDGLKAELARYVGSLADDRTKLVEAFGKPPTKEKIFTGLLDDVTQGRRVVIQREQIPPEYFFNGFPPELLTRLRKLTKKDEIIEEINAFHADPPDAANFRRMALDQEPDTQSPLQIIIVDAQNAASQPASSSPTISPLTVEPQRQINDSTKGKEKQ